MSDLGSQSSPVDEAETLQRLLLRRAVEIILSPSWGKQSSKPQSGKELTNDNAEARR